ncbi:MAG: DUF167 domain-containing protein [Patescibacteria group bacterium]
MRIITVHARPGAHEAGIEVMGENEYRVSVTQQPVRGAANRAVIMVLSQYFRVPPSTITVIRGATSRKKLIQIP